MPLRTHSAKHQNDNAPENARGLLWGKRAIEQARDGLVPAANRGFSPRMGSTSAATEDETTFAGEKIDDQDLSGRQIHFQILAVPKRAVGRVRESRMKAMPS